MRKNSRCAVFVSWVKKAFEAQTGRDPMGNEFSYLIYRVRAQVESLSADLERVASNVFVEGVPVLVWCEVHEVLEEEKFYEELIVERRHWTEEGMNMMSWFKDPRRRGRGHDNRASMLRSRHRRARRASFAMAA